MTIDLSSNFLSRYNFYFSAQEMMAKGKLETVPRLVALGLTLQQIATALDLPVEAVQKAVETGVN